MANRTFTGETDGNLNTATNWALDTKPVDGDTIVLDGDSNAPDGYANGTAPATALTTAGTFGLAIDGISGGISLNGILGDLTNQAIGNIAVVGGAYDHDSTESVTGSVALSTDSTYQALASHTVAGGITATDSHVYVAASKVMASAVALAGVGGAHLQLAAGASAIGAVAATGEGTVTMAAGSSIVGSFDADVNVVTWDTAGACLLVVNTTSDLVLGGVATGLDVQITNNATATLGADLSCNTLRLESGTTLDGGTNGLTLASGRIHGYGTVKNLVPAGIIHVAPGVVNGGGNHANVVFDPVQKDVVV